MGVFLLSRNWIVLLLHLIPFTYIGMAWDAYDQRLYGYFIAFILFCMLAYLQKSILLLFVGNLLSTGFSYVLAAVWPVFVRNNEQKAVPIV